MGRKRDERVAKSRKRDESLNLIRSLNSAALRGDLEEVKHLISSGVDIKEGGSAAVNYAIMEGHTEVVKLLVSAGEIMYSHVYPLRTAAERGHLDVIKFVISVVDSSENESILRNRATLKNDVAVSAVLSGQIEIAKFMVSVGVEVSELCKRWLIHHLAGTGQLDAVKYLVSLGADINTVDDDDNYPVKVAATNGQAETVRYLIDSGGMYDDDDIFELMKHMQKTRRSKEETLMLIDMMMVNKE